MSAPVAAEREAQADAVVRAMTDDGSFRVIALRTTRTVRSVTAAQGVSGALAGTLGELVTAAVLVRETMAPTLRVQTIYKLESGGHLVADSHPGGLTRGLSNVPATAEASAGERDLLEVVRSMLGGRLHQSVVASPGSLSAGVMEYMQTSEQVVSVVAVGCTAGLALAGGFIVQLLPGAHEGPLMVMTERLARDVADTSALLERTAGDPDAILAEILDGYAYTILERGPVFHGCNCSAARVISALASLGRAEIQELVTQGEGLQLGCEFCRRSYDVSLEQLRTLLEPS